MLYILVLDIFKEIGNLTPLIWQQVQIFHRNTRLIFPAQLLWDVLTRLDNIWQVNSCVNAE